MARNRILSTMADGKCWQTGTLAQQLGLSRSTVIKHCRALHAEGAVRLILVHDAAPGASKLERAYWQTIKQ